MIVRAVGIRYREWGWNLGSFPAVGRDFSLLGGVLAAVANGGFDGLGRSYRVAFDPATVDEEVAKSDFRFGQTPFRGLPMPRDILLRILVDLGAGQKHLRQVMLRETIAVLGGVAQPGRDRWLVLGAEL
jgi:hypothetical protein